MKFAKRTVALLLAVLFSLSLCACEQVGDAVDGLVSQLENEYSRFIDDYGTFSFDFGNSADIPDSLEPVGNGKATPLSPDLLPEYGDSPFAAVSGNVPNFSVSELSAVGAEIYSELDYLGRCGAAFAVCGREIMPAEDEKRGSISSIKPSGWVQHAYDFVDGGQLYNRSHLIGWQLSAENANKCNLVTGTRYMNTKGMLPFENMIADYIKETNGHVAYRVTPIFVGDELVCRGVQLEAYSIDDFGESICFNVFCFNVQPGVVINYKTGESEEAAS